MSENEDQYKTLQDQAYGKYEEKGSRFLAFGLPLKQPNEVPEIIRNFRENHPGARHVCYACSTGISQPEEQYSDDGEPGHTAGTPILGQIRSHDLRNCLVVVVRYFGGTKLGAGNLRSAYKTAAERCLTNSTIIARTITVPAKIRFPYNQTGAVTSILRKHHAEISESRFEASCTYSIEVPRKSWTSAREALLAVPELQLDE